MKHNGHGHSKTTQSSTPLVCDLPKPKHVGPLGLALHKAETPKKQARKRERAY